MPYAQIQIVDRSETSGIYEFRLNFDGTRLWTVTGDVARVKADAALINYSSFTSSRVTTELISALGDVQLDLNDCPTLRWNDGSPQVGSFIRECFEAARENEFQVTLLVGRNNKETGAFEEIVFRGSMNPREVPYAHRFIPKGVRRHETIACEFTPAIDLDTHVGEIQWQLADMASNISRPVWAAIVCEPGDKEGAFNHYRYLQTKMSRYITTGAGSYSGGGGGGAGLVGEPSHHPRQMTHIVGYGINPSSRLTPPNNYTDEPTGEGTWPIGNYAVTFGTAIEKACEAIDWEWDGVLPDINAREAEFDDGNNVNEDIGQINKDHLAFSYNYGFGVSPIDGQPFKGPCTWDSETEIRQMFAHIAAQWFSRADISGFTSDGKPILSFIAIGQDVGAMPDMGAGYERPDSSEDSFVTEADGVEIVRRGFDGSVIAPAGARKPVKIEIPFGTHAIAYESTPPFDVSRCMLNASLDFHEQWRCGFRGAIGDQFDTAEETGPYPLNPDGWGVASLLWHIKSTSANTKFPVKHDQHFPSGATIGFHDEALSMYDSLGWIGWYSPHAIYEKDRADLSDEERRARQKDCRISYAMAYGRYIRGERRRLVVEFKGVIAPGGSWQDIRTGQTYQFTPVDTEKTYILVAIERDVREDILICEFEEQAPIELPMTYKVVGSGNKGTGSIDMNGGGGSPPNDPPTTSRRVRRTVNFYQGASILKTLEMDCEEIFDGTNNRTVILRGYPPPYDEVAPEDYGQVSEYQFHYEGTEDAGIEIVGISATGVPDYQASAQIMYKSGTNDTDYNYRILTKYWSKAWGDFIVQRPLQVAAVKPRIAVRLRFHVDMTTPGSFGPFTILSLAAGTWPISDIDCETDTDLGYLGASSLAPVIAAAGNNITVTWDTTPPTGRYKPVTIMGQAWAFNPLDTPGAGTSAHPWQVGLNPVRNQQPTPQDVELSFWLNDLGGGGGAWQHITKAAITDLQSLFTPQLDEIFVELHGWLEVEGELS